MHLWFKEAVRDVAEVDGARLARWCDGGRFGDLFGLLFLSVRKFCRDRGESDGGGSVDATI